LVFLAARSSHHALSLAPLIPRLLGEVLGHATLAMAASYTR
jgi:hypothetical protein